MISSLPLYLLFAEAQFDEADGSCWRFSLEHVASGVTFSASDGEPIDCAERMELLAVVRGLEALDEPARVTLVTKSRYVSRGLRRGLAEWRHNGWQWERFGKLVPVRDWDLWRRVDKALEFHRVDCRLWQFEAPAGELEESLAEPVQKVSPTAGALGGTMAAGRQRVGRVRHAARRRLRQVASAARSMGEAVARPALAAS
ncbi:MAG: hypothetical protein KDA44_13295 [Planctomycetales bacterium]|nr:hypothetical protein [Planctomycetales bacterium]